MEANLFGKNVSFTWNPDALKDALAEFKSGNPCVLKDQQGNEIGTVQNMRIENDRLIADLVFSRGSNESKIT